MPSNEQLLQRIQQLEERLNQFQLADRYRFLLDIEIGTARGLKIGRTIDQKIGFWGVTPIVQPVAILTPSGGTTIDIQARSVIGTIITTIKSTGLTA